MGYQKTAKDLAWDRERIKLKSEISNWERAFRQEQKDKLVLANKNKELEDRIAALEQALTELTKGEMTPDEAVKHMRKQSDARDMLSLLAKHSSLFL
jgi:hypothetical protein